MSSNRDEKRTSFHSSFFCFHPLDFGSGPSRFNSEIVLKFLDPRAGINNDGRDAFLVMSSACYDRTCLWSADIFISVWQEFFLFL